MTPKRTPETTTYLLGIRSSYSVIDAQRCAVRRASTVPKVGVTLAARPHQLRVRALYIDLANDRSSGSQGKLENLRYDALNCFRSCGCGTRRENALNLGN